MKSPCVQSCPRRSAICRATCRAFQEYDRQRMAGYAARDREREKEQSLSPFNSPSFKRYGRPIKEREV